MKTSELIHILSESLSINGDLAIVGMADGIAFENIELNAPDSDSPLYIEFYKD